MPKNDNLQTQVTKLKIFILEDNPDSIELFKDSLAALYDLKFASRISEINQQELMNQSFNAMIADMKLPDGIFLEWVMTSKSTIMESLPTMIVSSMEDIETLRNSFEWGAVDYLVKPYRKNELLVKLERILAIKNPAHQKANEILDDLTMIENKIFQFMQQSLGKPLSRDLIISSVWKKVRVNPKTLDVHLSNLRKKLQNSDWKIEFDTHGWKMTKKIKES